MLALSAFSFGLTLNSSGLTLWRTRIRKEPYKLTGKKFGPVLLIKETRHN
jgi:hypothetical protein